MTAQTKYLDRLYIRLIRDKRINAWHISVFMGVYYLWCLNGMRNPVPVTRRKLMDLSRLQSFMTYHKCIKQLVDYGYIEYTPSYHPREGSRVNLVIG